MYDFDCLGYKLSKCEVLSAPKATPEELAEDPEHPWPNGFALFRCIVHLPGQRYKYVSFHVASKDELETQEFWRYFWDYVANLKNQTMENDNATSNSHDTSSTYSARSTN